MKKILNVRQAAKILGVSTNTMYKYLNQGTITAARGQGKGSFRIPIRSLELFLGSTISEEALTTIENDTTLPSPASPATNTRSEAETLPISAEPSESASLPIKVSRYLLLFGLLFVIVDIATTTQFSFANQLSRIAILAILTLLAYQQGGFVKK